METTTAHPVLEFFNPDNISLHVPQDQYGRVLLQSPSHSNLIANEKEDDGLRWKVSSTYLVQRYDKYGQHTK